VIFSAYLKKYYQTHTKRKLQLLCPKRLKSRCPWDTGPHRGTFASHSVNPVPRKFHVLNFSYDEDTGLACSEQRIKRNTGSRASDFILLLLLLNMCFFFPSDSPVLLEQHTWIAPDFVHRTGQQQGLGISVKIPIFFYA